MKYIIIAQGPTDPQPKQYQINANSDAEAVAKVEGKGYRVFSVENPDPVELPDDDVLPLPPQASPKPPGAPPLPQPTPQPARQPSGVQWHYSTDGKRSGGVSDIEIEALIQQKKINSQSFMWNSTLPDWVPISQTEFGSLLVDANAPPPLTGDAVNNTLVWILACVPAIGMVVKEIFTQHPFGVSVIAKSDYWLITAAVVIANIVLCEVDSRKLKAVGHDTSKMGAAWLVPIYLFKRSKILNHNLAYFGVWCGTFTLSLFIHRTIV